VTVLQVSDKVTEEQLEAIEVNTELEGMPRNSALPFDVSGGRPSDSLFRTWKTGNRRGGHRGER